MSRATGVVSRDVLLAEDGVSFLRGILDGRHPGPPFADAMDFDLAEVEEGRVVFVGKPSPRFFNPLGTIHGGWTATILDSAMACAAHSTLRIGEGYTTLEMKLNYVRPVMPESGEVRCEGKLIHRGGTIATTEGRLVDARGKLLAHGTETCMIFSGQAAAGR
ncbi:PaaI family thioesterase [Bosea sp. (in: a-proteobacteria)]|uniref:PaaI family thioesterase n=1 Tax=Bosea sp. (in: a-proteobacteria) TaxID=1871050 RepID=UPI002FC8C5CB